MILNWSTSGQDQFAFGLTGWTWAMGVAVAASGGFMCIPAGTVYIPGAQALQRFRPGPQAAQVYTPGAQAAERVC